MGLLYILSIKVIIKKKITTTSLVTSPSHSGEGVPIAIGRGGEVETDQIINP